MLMSPSLKGNVVYVLKLKDIQDDVQFRMRVPEDRLKYMSSAAPGFYLYMLTHFSARLNALATYGIIKDWD